MEPEGSLLCSQEPSTGPYPEPIVAKIHFNIIHQSTTSLSSGPFISGFRAICYVYSSCPDSCFTSCQSHPRFHFVAFCNKTHVYGKFLAPRSTSKLGEHPLSAFRDCLFNISAATLPISGSSLLHQQPEDAPSPGGKRTHLTRHKNHKESRTVRVFLYKVNKEQSTRN
jgi:hypothetical protein